MICFVIPLSIGHVAGDAEGVEEFERVTREQVLETGLFDAGALEKPDAHRAADLAKTDNRRCVAVKIELPG